MHKTRLDNQANGITEARNGKTFSFTSPIPGLFIYDGIWSNFSDFLSKIESDDYWVDGGNPANMKWKREDYLDEETGKRGETCRVWNDIDVKNALSDVVDSYLNHWNIDPKSRESLRITKFSGNGEFFGMHSDDTFATPRTVSMVYYPNDDYEGGELDFIHFGVRIKPKAGQLFLFPSGYSYEHKVTPVTGGNDRITVVCFFNEITYEERTARATMIDSDKFYSVKLKDVFQDGE